YKLNYLDTLYGKTRLRDITSENIEDFLKSKVLDNTFSQSTLTQAKKSFTVFFNWVVKKNYLKLSPMKAVGKLKSDKDTQERLNPIQDADFDKIMNRIKELNNLNLYYFVCFVYHACIRPNE